MSELYRNGELAAAHSAREEVFPTGASGGSLQGGMSPVSDPAPWALRVTPEHRAKVEKALNRAARQIALHLLREDLGLQGRKFCVELRLLVTKAFSYLICVLQ